jgi:hypothetical protein
MKTIDIVVQSRRQYSTGTVLYIKGLKVFFLFLTLCYWWSVRCLCYTPVSVRRYAVCAIPLDLWEGTLPVLYPCTCEMVRCLCYTPVPVRWYAACAIPLYLWDGTLPVLYPCTCEMVRCLAACCLCLSSTSPTRTSVGTTSRSRKNSERSRAMSVKELWNICKRYQRFCMYVMSQFERYTGRIIYLK